MLRPVSDHRNRAAFARPCCLAAVVIATLLGAGPLSPAAAQFSFLGQSEVSPQDVAATIQRHGFRLVGPLFRNGRVYVADVIDRRRQRERLVISASSGEIVQRFAVDVSRPDSMGGAPRRATVAREEDNDGFFSRLMRGWGDDEPPPPRPPAGLDLPGTDEAVMPRTEPRTPRLPRPRPTEPRVVTRSEDAPITAAPLPPPTAGAIAPASPSQAVTPAAPPSSTRATSVASDPLRIPGKKEPEAPKPAAALAKAPAKPVSTDVPVAPLD